MIWIIPTSLAVQAAQITQTTLKSNIHFGTFSTRDILLPVQILAPLPPSWGRKFWRKAPKWAGSAGSEYQE